jgi:hypothetical protein
MTSTGKIGASPLRSGWRGRRARTRWSAWSETLGRIRRPTQYWLEGDALAEPPRVREEGPEPRYYEHMSAI